MINLAIKSFHISHFKKNSALKTSLKKIVTIILLLTLILTIPTGCKNSYSKLLSYSVTTIPKNLDPQTACDSDEISIINNVFEGLYKQNSNNSYSFAAAMDEKHNSDKTKFLFTLKPNRFWTLKSEDNATINEFEQPLTAADFEFAFKRLLKPETNSPFAITYYFIKNAKQVNEGTLSVNNLGVKAVSSNQLLIELEHPTPNLEELLSLAPAMPCNEKFFKHTNGRYGLSIDTIMCNGKFFIHQWPQNQKDKKLRLRINKKHPENETIKILGINLSQRPANRALKLIKKNEIDSAFFDASASELGNLGLNNAIQFQNSTSGLIFNQNSALFRNEKIRQALALTIDRKQIENNLNPAKATIAENIVPNSVTIAGESFQKLKNLKSTCPNFNLEKAKELFNAGLNEIKPHSKNKKVKTNLNLNNFTVLINENHYCVINEILQNWQQNLNLYLKTEICNDETYLKKLKSQNFDCALITIENEFNSPSCMLNKFLPNSPLNFANIQLPNLKQTLTSASNATSLDDIVKNYMTAEQEILNSACFIPVYHPIKTFIYSKKFDNITLVKSCKQLFFDSTTPKD